MYGVKNGSGEVWFVVPDFPLNGFYNGQTYNLIQKHGIYITNNYIITQ